MADRPSAGCLKRLLVLMADKLCYQDAGVAVSGGFTPLLRLFVCAGEGQFHRTRSFLLNDSLLLGSKPTNQYFHGKRIST